MLKEKQIASIQTDLRIAELEIDILVDELKTWEIHGLNKNFPEDYYEQMEKIKRCRSKRREILNRYLNESKEEGEKEC